MELFTFFTRIDAKCPDADKDRSCPYGKCQ